MSETFVGGDKLATRLQRQGHKEGIVHGAVGLEGAFSATRLSARNAWTRTGNAFTASRMAAASAALR